MDLDIHIVTGRLGHDPELLKKETFSVVNFSIGIDKTTFGENGPNERTIWKKLSAFNKVAAAICETCKKGDLILVKYEIDRHEYQKKDGTHVIEDCGNVCFFKNLDRRSQKFEQAINDELDIVAARMMMQPEKYTDKDVSVVADRIIERNRFQNAD